MAGLNWQFRVAHHADDGGKDVFVHVSAVQKAGMQTLNEGQKVSYEIVTERGKQAAGNLRPA